MSGAYEALLRNVLFPLYESGMRRRNTMRYLAEYEHGQWLAPEELARLQWGKLKRLLEHAYREVPYYRRSWDAIGIRPEDIRTPAEYAKLPLLTKAGIRENFDDLVAGPQRGHLLYKATGGSTGEPLRFGYTRESYERRTAVMWRGYAWAGAHMGQRTLFLWGGAVGTPRRAALLKDRLYHAALNRRMLDSFHMSESNLAEYANAIDRFRPEIIVSYVGPLVRLAEWLIETGRKVARPAAILGAAEALYEPQREAIERAFGAPAYNTYGCREFMLIAAECECRDGLHLSADHLYVETLAPTGDVVVTDLHNYGMPFIRYVNGDLATAADGICACGRGLPRLRRVDGRKLDAIRTPAGHLLPGEFFPHMLKDVRGVRRFQVVQRSLGTLDITLVRSKDYVDDDLAYIRRELARVLGDSVDLRFHFADSIPMLANGKFRVTICELAEDDSKGRT